MMSDLSKYHYSLKLADNPTTPTTPTLAPAAWLAFKYQGKTYYRCEFSLNIFQNLVVPDGRDNNCIIKINDNTMITVSESKTVVITKVYTDKILKEKTVKVKFEYSYEPYSDYYFKGVLEIPSHLKRGIMMKFTGSDFLGILKGIADKTVGFTENEIVGIIESLLNK